MYIHTYIHIDIYIYIGFVISPLLQQIISINLHFCQQSWEGLDFEWDFKLPNKICRRKGFQIDRNKVHFKE